MHFNPVGKSWHLASKARGTARACLLLTPVQWQQLANVDLHQSVVSAVSSPSDVSIEDPFLKKELSNLKEEWSIHFACIEALLTMGSNPLSAQPVSAPVFSPVKVTHSL